MVLRLFFEAKGIGDVEEKISRCCIVSVGAFRVEEDLQTTLSS
jgi:hypothetical protein